MSRNDGPIDQYWHYQPNGHFDAVSEATQLGNAARGMTVHEQAYGWFVNAHALDVGDETYGGNFLDAYVPISVAETRLLGHRYGRDAALITESNPHTETGISPAMLSQAIYLSIRSLWEATSRAYTQWNTGTGAGTNTSGHDAHGWGVQYTGGWGGQP